MGGPGAAGESKPLRRPDVRASVGGPSVGTEAAASSGVVAEGERGVAGGGERPGEARKSQPTCEAKRLGPEEATGQGLGWTGRLAWCGRPGHGAREKPWSLGQKGVRAEALPRPLPGHREPPARPANPPAPPAAPSKRRAPPPLPPPLNLGTRSGLSTSARRPPALRAPGCHRAWPPGSWRRAKGWPAALAGNRTRVNCLEGSYAHHYTTNAAQPGPPPDARPGFGPGVCTRSGHRLWSPPRRPSAPRPCPDDPPIHSAALPHGPAAAARRPTRASPTRLGGSVGPPACQPTASGGRWRRPAAPGTTPHPPPPFCRPGNPVPRDPRPSDHVLAPGVLHRVLGEATSRAHGGPDTTEAPPPRRTGQRRITGEPGAAGHSSGALGTTEGPGWTVASPQARGPDAEERKRVAVVDGEQAGGRRGPGGLWPHAGGRRTSGDTHHYTNEDGGGHPAARPLCACLPTPTPALDAPPSIGARRLPHRTRPQTNVAGIARGEAAPQDKRGCHQEDGRPRRAEAEEGEGEERGVGWGGELPERRARRRPLGARSGLCEGGGARRVGGLCSRSAAARVPWLAHTRRRQPAAALAQPWFDSRPTQLANLLHVSRTPVARPGGSREPGAREAGVLRCCGRSGSPGKPFFFLSAYPPRQRFGTHPLLAQAPWLLPGPVARAPAPGQPPRPAQALPCRLLRAKPFGLAEDAAASVPTEGPPTDARTSGRLRGLDSPAAPGPPMTSDPLLLHPEPPLGRLPHHRPPPGLAASPRRRRWWVTWVAGSSGDGRREAHRSARHVEWAKRMRAHPGSPTPGQWRLESGEVQKAAGENPTAQPPREGGGPPDTRRLRQSTVSFPPAPAPTPSAEGLLSARGGSPYRAPADSPCAGPNCRSRPPPQDRAQRLARHVCTPVREDDTGGTGGHRGGVRLRIGREAETFGRP
ncbi:collagen alpha-1(I) chain-like [Neovison vison]|uniref:collagen alpha-1(I) chain-like n=1 Tax=Neovison vison TaxID=452646 RepID=UPI001CF07985|nr:collagen alpha-1(I) chain-like [Neogale vison]